MEHSIIVSDAVKKTISVYKASKDCWEAYEAGKRYLRDFEESFSTRFSEEDWDLAMEQIMDAARV